MRLFSVLFSDNLITTTSTLLSPIRCLYIFKSCLSDSNFFLQPKSRKILRKFFVQSSGIVIWPKFSSISLCVSKTVNRGRVNVLLSHEDWECYIFLGVRNIALSRVTRHYPIRRAFSLFKGAINVRRDFGRDDIRQCLSRFSLSPPFEHHPFYLRSQGWFMILFGSSRSCLPRLKYVPHASTNEQREKTTPGGANFR